MINFLLKLIGDPNEKKVKKISGIIDHINALEPEFEKLSDEELRAKTDEFKAILAKRPTSDNAKADRILEKEALDKILPEAFATVREAGKRVLNMRHFDVQLIGAYFLHNGHIAEMRTGEGKTLVATLAAYLNALTGKGVHVVTVNDYLAKRDSEWMGKIYKFLGLSVGVILSNQHDADEFNRKRAAYACDITYGTNNEFGFDYLRDNMVIYKEQLVQRELNYAIVDEIDSILIDEARTPLIISGRANESSDLYKKADNFVRRLTPKVIVEEDIKDFDQAEDNEKYDYIVDLKAKSASLTGKGIKKAEEAFGLENFNDLENSTLVHHVNQALRAHGVMKKDIDYIVKDGEVLIVDEFTGRIMYGRRYNNGLHQAIEAKEHVKIADESKTLATITFQNFFRMYDKLSGMTGTAMTEDKEFMDIYGMDVVEIPTNKPMIRVDHEDAIYMTKKEKLNAVINDIVESHKKGQPVLVGTINIDTSEEVSELLSKRGIKHNVLNAKFHELEAEIVSHAGERGAVTIATNMAGRGTDIKLEDGVAELGGLKIIGTERHESRRIDNQLRGRAGRQGDPGESKFYLSLEDDLMRLFGSERMMGVYKALKIPEGEEIQHKTITKQIEKAQKKIENNNFGIRRNLLDYDQVNNDQREVIYAERRRVLNGESMRDVVYKMIKDVVADDVNMVAGEQPLKELNLVELNESLRRKIPLEPITLTDEEKEKNDKEALISRLQDEAMKVYHKKEKDFNEFAKVNVPEEGVELGEEDAAIFNDGIREVERVILLKVIDSKWMNHIDDMDQLRESIGLQSYAQKDPVVQYKFLGYDMFEEMTKNIRHDTVGALMHVQIEQKVERKQVARATGTNKDELVERGPYRRKEAKIGRNAPCPCGSGKKYKNCCGRFAN